MVDLKSATNVVLILQRIFHRPSKPQVLLSRIDYLDVVVQMLRNRALAEAAVRQLGKPLIR